MINYVQPGSRLTWTNGGFAVTSGAVVVVGNLIGIATGDIGAGATGELAMDGVFTVPKVSGAVIAVGEKVMWDASAGAFDDSAASPATGDVTVCCVAWAAAGNGDTTLPVKINVGVGTVA